MAIDIDELATWGWYQNRQQPRPCLDSLKLAEKWDQR
jgi:hypothetical protein